MRMRYSLLALVALALSVPVRAQLATGDPLPSAETTLPAADGSSQALSGAAGEGGLVVVFWSNVCPWAGKYTDRLADLVGEYVPAGIGFVLVNANSPEQIEAEGAAASREAMAEAGLAVPYLLDGSGALASAFGVRSAPQVFFFGPDRTLVYSGAIDDSPASAVRVRAPYLQQAMDQTLAGLPVEVRQTQAFGCTIKTAP